ncbi:MAG: response regulator transcription factor [Turicibacter sp.]
MSKKILVVDDDLDILDMLYDALGDDGYLVYRAPDSNSALAQLKHHPDLILLDVMMPEVSGFEFCKEIRETVTCPIIFLTAKTSETDLIHGLAIGGDDYVTKPFSIRALKAKINAHLRREQRLGNPSDKQYLIFNGFKIHLKQREVYCLDQKVMLTKREYEILEYLTLNAGQVLSKEMIYEKIWGLEADGDVQTVAEHVKKIRAKCLAANPTFSQLQTVWGVGYKWDPSSGGRHV